MDRPKFKGRGAGSNPPNRFERLHIEENEDTYANTEINGGGERKVETVFFKDYSRSVIAKNDSEDIFFDYSVNPYRGCEHGCVYCYARPTHEFLGFSSGVDFESKIMVKQNAAQLLREEFNKKKYIPKLIMISGDTDPYQPVENKLKITRSVLEVCLEYGNPVSIITKNSLILRDLDIIKEMSGLNLISVMLSITTLNKELTSKMEPRTTVPERRLNVVEKMAEAGIPVGVNIAPVIPGLNDNEIPEILKLSAERGASFAGYTMLRLPYSIKELFIEWLERELPDRKEKILNKIREMRGGKLNEAEIGKRFKGQGEQADAIRKLYGLSCKKYRLNERDIDLTTEHFKRRTGIQLEIF